MTSVTHDKSFYKRLVIQGLLATSLMFLVLFLLDFVRANSLIWAAGASSLASTAFIVFGTPNVDAAKPHRIFIGYLIAILCGHLIRMLADYLCLKMSLCLYPAYLIHVHEVAAVIALILTFFVMAMLRSSHAPAAGLAVVMVIDITNINAILIIGGSSLMFALIMLLFKKHLKRLI